MRTSETFCFKAFSTSRKTGSASTQSCSAKSRSVCINVTSFCLFHSESRSFPGITNFTSILIFYGLSRDNLQEFFLKNVSWMSPGNLVEIGRAGVVAPCRTQIGSDTLPVKRNRRECCCCDDPKFAKSPLAPDAADSGSRYVDAAVPFFSRPRSAGWLHRGRTFSIYLCHSD